MKWVDRFKTLPKSTKNLLVVGVLLALVAALPLFIWAITTQKFLFTQKAATGEPGVCVADSGNLIEVTPPGGSGSCHDIQAAIDAVTGSDYTIRIMQGTYNITNTIRVDGKSHITLTGPSWQDTPYVLLNFAPSVGHGILITNSSGQLNFISMYGPTPNGTLSIQDSREFFVGRISINAVGSHAVDIQRSNYISIGDANISSSAGAIEVSSTDTVYITANRIQDSDNAISINDALNVNILYNIINANRESAVRLRNVTGLTAEHNTILNNGIGGNFPAVDVQGYVSREFKISNNLIVFNQHGGINYSGSSTNLSGYFRNNDLYMNDIAGSSNNLNYIGVPDQTGTNGNIAQDPLINYTNAYYCLRSGSPALYGNQSLSEFMGRSGLCGTEPTPISTPTPTPGTRCTLEAKICPDGSSVGRVPPNCDFAPCPSPTARPGAGECQLCGGIAGIPCQAGLRCQYPARLIYPDQAGVCVKYDGTSSCSPTPSYRTFGILFKFDGVTDGSADGAKVVAIFLNRSWGIVSYATGPITAHYVASGVYSLNFSVPSNTLPPSNEYSIVLQGEKHSQVKFCFPQGQTDHCKATTTGNITVPDTKALISLNFTGIPLPAGDTITQDGIVNYVDYDRVFAILSKSSLSQTDNDRLVGDLNYDGRVDGYDVFLLMKTLGTKYNEY